MPLFWAVKNFGLLCLSLLNVKISIAHSGHIYNSSGTSSVHLFDSKFTYKLFPDYFTICINYHYFEPQEKKSINVFEYYKLKIIIDNSLSSLVIYKEIGSVNIKP